MLKFPTGLINFKHRVGKRILIILYVIGVFSCSKQEGIDLRETFSATDAKPFGGMVANQLFNQYYASYYVVKTNHAVSKNSMLKSDANAVFFSISRHLFLEDEDVQTILNRVYEGNTFFFSSAYFDTSLMNTINCRVSETAFPVSNTNLYTDARVRLIADLGKGNDSTFGYFYRPFRHYFSTINPSYGRILGYNGEGYPNFIVIFWGKGKLMLHSEPRAFSNYFLLTRNNYRYMENILQVLGDSPGHVYWDDYYRTLTRKPAANNGGGTLNEFLKQPPLAWAFYLLAALLAAYVLFNGKRKQREIRVIAPNMNSSVAFSETIARLYMQEGNHKAIALKMVTHFQEFLKTNYYLDANINRHDLVLALSRKSGVSEDDTRSLFVAIDKLAMAREVTDSELFKLHSQMQEFYNNRK